MFNFDGLIYPKLVSQVTHYTATVERAPEARATFPKQPDIIQDVRCTTIPVPNKEGHTVTQAAFIPVRLYAEHQVEDQAVGDFELGQGHLQGSPAESEKTRSGTSNVSGLNVFDAQASVNASKCNLLSDLADALQQNVYVDSRKFSAEESPAVEAPPPYIFDPPPPYVLFGPCGPDCYRNRLIEHRYSGGKDLCMRESTNESTMLLSSRL